MRSLYAFLLAVFALGVGLFPGPAAAQDAPAGQGAPQQTPADPTPTGFEVLRGRWVRPDGGYVVTIHGAQADGTLDAIYSNPRFLPFSQAQATQTGKDLHVFLEIRAAGYNGSTYTLTYDPQKDVLWGVYYQAVAKQSFDVFFIREKE